MPSSVLYAFGVLLANIQLKPVDARVELTLASIRIIMEEMDIILDSYSIINGFANASHISIEEARNQLDEVQRLLVDYPTDDFSE